MTRTKAKKAKAYVDKARFGILNPYGDVWTPETFTNAFNARAYLRQQAARLFLWNLKRHRIVPVCVTVTPLDRKPKAKGKKK